MKQLKILSCLVIFTLLAAACQGATPTAAPTTDPALILTAAAQTAAVRLTQMVAQTPSATPTSTTPTPDLAQTAAASTIAAQLTATAAASSPTPTPTVTATAPAASTGGVDRAEFVGETIPDGTVFAPGALFKKTWKLKNAGTSTWTTQYALVFVQGDRLNAPDRIMLTKNVLPGETVEIGVDLTAPTVAKTFRGYFKMLNAAGVFFNDSVYVDIAVSATTGTPTVTGTPGTPTPSLTPTATSAGFTVSNATMVGDTQVYSGTCPHTLTFTARFTANTPGQITYVLKAESSTPGFTFSLPPATTMNAVTGENVLQFFLEMKSNVVGWVALHITAPVDVTSSQANFSVTCAP